MQIIAICLGACAGALARWGANLLLNPICSAIPLGTLAVNWLGSFLMGLALAFFASFDGNSGWKLLLITGFVGSFTTFSAFSGEMASLLQAGRADMCLLGICLHVFGSIALVFAGLRSFGLLSRLLA